MTPKRKTASSDLDRLTKAAIQAHLKTEPGPEERDLIDGLRGRFGAEWSAWHAAETRKLYAEWLLGLSGRWVGAETA